MATKKAAPKATSQRVIVRSVNAGVHHGILVARDGDVVTLRDSERLFYWKVAAMTGQVSSCSELARNGINREQCKLGARLDETTILGACEIIPVHADAIGYEAT
jgi:hypothetical protein